MLSFPGFVTRLAREHGLFDMLLKCLTDFFDQFSTLTDGSDTTRPSAGGGDGEPMETETEAGNEAATSGEETEAGSGGQGNIKRRQRKLIDLTQRILRAEKSPWERVIGDLDMALDHRSTSALFIFGLPGAFTTWQHILAMLHGTLPIPFNTTLFSKCLRHDTTRHDTTRHDTTRHDTTRHDTHRHECE
jgi:hypothetical protein